MRTSVLTVLLLASVGVAQDVPAVDLLAMPSALRRHNISSKGSGCCTFRSAEYAAHWQHVPALFGLPEWMRSKGIAGGGTPSKQARMVEMIAADRGLPTPAFCQYTGRDPAIIELALRTGRAPGVTWNGNHMLTCCFLDSERGAVLDNNRPDVVQWYSRSEFLRRWTAGGGGWVFILLAPAPSPPPASGVRPPVEDTPPGGVMLDYKWEPASGEGRYFLFLNGRQVGFWDGEQYLPLLRPGRFGEPCELPCELPQREIYGVEKWDYQAEAYWINGKDVPRGRVFEALGDGLDDDSGRPHLTVIGPEADRERVLTDLRTHPALRGLTEGLRVQSYAPDYWAVKGFGFKTDGRPTIYLQDASGKVLHRQDDYDGPDRLAAALRRPDPNYRPDGDSDRRKPVGPDGKPVEPSDGAPPWEYAGGGAVLAGLGLYLTRKKKGA